MANPSTQPPSNATTTNVIFSRDFVQSSYTLLEVPKCLEKYLEDNGEDGTLSFQIRGTDQDTAVLCTSTETFSLQRAHTSNMLMPIAPIIRPIRRVGDMDLDMNMNMSMDTDTDMDTEDVDDPYQINHPDIQDSLFERHTVLDIMDSVLDLIPISPRLDRLHNLLGQCLFEGWAHESKVKGRLYTWKELQSVIQASDNEILQWLREHHAKEINGHWRLFRKRFMYDILTEILVSIGIDGMTVDSIDGAKLCQPFEDSENTKETGIEAWMVEHCLKSFSDDEPTNDSGIYRLSPAKVCTFMGVHLLSMIERGKRWRLDDFMNTWKKALHDYFQPDLTYLAGECFVEAERGLERKQQMVNYIRYFPKSRLPIDVASRFTALFEIKEKWDGQEIRPFLRDLVLDEKKLNILLLKHARSVKQPGGGIIYSNRVIK
ncbi:Sister chromatid cohesion protein DCC1 [Mortierella claussenii]|nr:Sister chromatid cohesion protein DCC1 [Mortierella claussenii]